MCHGWRLGRAQATVHETRRGLILHDLGDKGYSFYQLTAGETDHWKLTTERPLGQPSMAVGTTSGGAPAPGTSLAVAV
jgi:hypothetical protein